MKYFCGIDLGGTKIYTVLVNRQGKIVGKAKIKTKNGENSNNLDSVLNRIVECYKMACNNAKINEKDIKAIGMGVPSAVNIDKGLLIHAPNLGWKDIKIKNKMEEKLKKSVFVDNDVNIGLYGEYVSGKGIKYKHLYGVFVGTGIGGGYILNGKIIRGLNYTAGEIGHMIIDIDGDSCNCGNRGCLESIAGKVGIINYIKKRIDESKETTLLDEINPEWRISVGSSAIRKCFERKDKLITEAINRASKAIGIACANIINLMGVEAIILGGGLIEEMWDMLIPSIRENTTKYSMANGSNGVDLIKSQLGDDAIALGGAYYVMRKH